MCARVDTGKENQDKDKGKHNMTLLMTMEHLSCLSYGIYLNRNILLI